MKRATMIFIIGCSDVKSDSGQRDDQATVNIAGTVTNLIGGQPHVDVTMCTSTSSSCTQTDEVGLYSLIAPADSDDYLSAEFNEFRPALIPFVSESGPITLPPISLSPESVVTALLSTALLEESENTGIIAFSISNGIAGDGVNIPNIEVSVNNASTTTVYSAENGLPQRDLMETSNNGGGVIVNVPAGTASLELNGLPENCIRLLGHGNADVISTPVIEGYVSIIRVECAE